MGVCAGRESDVHQDSFTELLEGSEMARQAWRGISDEM